MSRREPARHDGVARRVDAAENRRRPAAADGSRGLSGAVGAQADRLDPHPYRPEPRGPRRPAAADLGCPEAAAEGNRDPGESHREPVRDRPADDHHAGAGRMVRHSVRPAGGPRQRERRPAAAAGDHVDGGVRHHHRRLVRQLEVLVHGRDARVGADDLVRNPDGLRDGRHPDGVGLAELLGHRGQPGARHVRRPRRELPVVELAAAAAAVRHLHHVRPGRVQPPPVRRGGRRIGNRGRPHGRVLGHVVRDVHAGGVRQHDPRRHPGIDHVPGRLVRTVLVPRVRPDRRFLLAVREDVRDRLAVHLGPRHLPALPL
ncbi:hypothetical protein Lal_00014790 [Lupinus albus]|nr:hypothetical protein Lal_00014790 [Lupinus albus]